MTGKQAWPVHNTTIGPWIDISEGGKSYGWDEYGYVPPNSVANKLPQNAWKTPATAANYRGNKLSVTADPLGTWGSVVVDQTNYGGNAINASVFKEATVVDQAHRKNWLLQDQTDQSKYYCNPFNFPICSMQPMRDGGAKVTMWDGTPVDTTNQWQLSVDKVTEEFMNGNYDWLFERDAQNNLVVNPVDTTTSSPCDESGFDIGSILGLAIGAFAVIGGNMLTSEIPPEILPLSARFTSTIALAGTGYYYGLYASSLLETARPDYLNKCSIAAGAGAGAVVGGIIGQQLGVALIGDVAGAAGGYYMLTPLVESWLPDLTFGGSFVLSFVRGAVKFLTWGISKIECEMGGLAISACQNAKFTDGKARRWDTPSIAVMILHEMIKDGQVTAGSPQAEFIFRGLLTGPALMMSGSVTSPNGDAYSWIGTTGETIFDRAVAGANPIGEFAPYQWDFDSTTGTYMLNQYYSPDGGYASDSNQLGGQNGWACQNWDTLRTAPQYALFNSNIDNWKAALLEKSADFKNLTQQSFIPGWTSKLTTDPCEEGVEKYRAPGASSVFGSLYNIGVDADGYVKKDCFNDTIDFYQNFYFATDIVNLIVKGADLGTLCKCIAQLKTEMGLVKDHQVYLWMKDWFAPAYVPPHDWIGDIFDTGVCKGPPAPPPTSPPNTIDDILEAWASSHEQNYFAMENWTAQWTNVSEDTRNGIKLAAGVIGLYGMQNGYDPTLFTDDYQKMIFLKFATTPIISLKNEWLSGWENFYENQQLVADLALFNKDITPLPATLLYPAGSSILCTNDWPNFTGVVSTGDGHTMGGYYVADDGSLQHYPDHNSLQHWDPSGALIQAPLCKIFQGGVDKTFA